MHLDALLAEVRAIRDVLRLDPPAGRARLEALAARSADSPQRAVATDLLLATDGFFGGRYDEAEALGRRAYEHALQCDSSELAADAAVVVGNIEYERGEYSEAAEWYTRAARQFEAAGATGELGRIHNNLGLVAWRMRDLPRAETHFDAALRQYGPEGDPRIVGNLHNNLGLVYEDSGDPSAAEAAYRRAVDLLRGAGDDQYLANALANLGDLLIERRELAAARKLHDEALAARLRVGHLRGVTTSHVALGRIAHALGEPDEARTHAEAALVLARQIGLRKQESDALALRARVSEQDGDYLGALRDERAAAALREQVFGEQMSERVAALQLRFEAWQARLQARRAEEEKARMTETLDALRAADEARTRFLAMMSHELRTPLTSAIGAAELLRLRTRDAEQLRLVDVIAASSEALLAAIGDVLDLTRAGDGRLSLTTEPVSPRAIAEQVRAMVSPGAEARGLELSLDISADVPPWIRSDGARLRQLLLNIASNAVKFTDHGRVTVRVGRQGDTLVLEVEDTGIGIPASYAPHVFEAFSQADPSPTRRHGGVGLGLTIAQRIVSAMGGALTFRSTVDVGTTFTARVPLVASEPPSIAAPDHAPARFRALLVEDDDAVREVLGELLTACGAEVDAVSDGAAGLARYVERPADVVVLDVHMPGMDGLTVARRLREAHGAGVRILGLSGATSEADRLAAVRAGFDGWLPKPTPLRKLLAELVRLGVARGEGAERMG